MRENLRDLNPIRRNKTLVEEVIETVSTYILQGLLDGHLKPGDKLPSEREFAETLQVGRSTLREAIQVLVALRLLEIRPGHGTFISDGSSDFNADPFSWGLILKEQSLSELIETRILIEGEMASLAAHRASECEINEIAESFQKMEIALQEKDPVKLVDTDVEFHMLTAQAAHNNVMYQTLRTIRTLLQLWISKVITLDEPSMGYTVAEHRDILQGLISRNSDLARDTMKKHITNASKRLSDVMLLNK